ncbi:hypothetical protein TIFTF001_026349 [Ficus carica]|uniref:Uncharacterized protein n=1 Tax=Ficus carica TaxID=3494 RepID=A0AA88DL05_FICCA|nr:hypothetical protein TIFTF001_026349 [Ficus carica]
MKRKQVFLHLLFAFLLLASRCRYSSTAFAIRAAESVKLNIEHVPERKTLAIRQMLSAWVESRKIGKESIHKVPSGPNPIGNGHPPSIHG